MASKNESEDSVALMRKELDVRLSAYVPAVVRRYLEQQGDLHRVPATHETRVVSMFADVSGFTQMTESLAARGPVGAETLAKHLNSYFEQLLRLVSSAGGDVFKFAGDAMLIFWSENKDDTLESLLRRCVQCALRIQAHLHKAELAPGVVLSVKMGIGIGGATIAHLGGMSDGSTARIEYIAVGPALAQAFHAEHQADAGDVICSSECWRMIERFVSGEPRGDCFKLLHVDLPIKLCSRRPSFTRDDAALHQRMKQYVSRAVWPYLDAHDEFWGSELRDVTVLFINLGFSEQELATMLDTRGLQKLQDAYAVVQKCIYEYEGTINKFLIDDKGSTVIAAFGLPPVTHENDPVRGILASLAICAALGDKKLGLKASVGITTGIALCGVVGHQGNRREYTVLGDIVNLSARLMQRAKSERGGVITDAATKLYAQDMLHFEERPEIMVKGKNDSIKIHRPYPRMSMLLEYHLSSPSIKTKMGASQSTPIIANVMENMHRVQVRDAQRRLSVRETASTSDQLIESDAFRSIRDRLLDKCSQLNRFAPGGAFIVEGDIGIGKTVLLKSVLGGPEAGCYNVLQSTASPFATRKPYAIWADVISKCAFENVGAMETTELPLSPSSTGPSGALPLSPTMRQNDISRELVRRKQIAMFVKRKIQEGAAPNTTLVDYAYLLNPILETEFENEKISTKQAETHDAQARRISGRGPSIRLLDERHENNEEDLAQQESDTNNQEDDEENEEDDEEARDSERQTTECETEVQQEEDPQEEEEEEMIERPQFGSLGSPNSWKVKEEAIASWFLGLLEMDLAANQRESDQSDHVAPRKRSSFQRSEHVDEENEEEEGYRERESEWRPTDLDMSGILLLCALHAISRERATIFCLDNAMYMDEKSWILTTIIAKYFTNCLIVMGTRPPSMASSSGERTESSSFRKQLRVLTKMPNTIKCVLEPMDNPLIQALAHQILQVPTIPDDLMAILLARSQGNPLFLKEIISELIQQQVIKVDLKRQLCTMQVQEPWAEKHQSTYCFYCHLKFTSSKEKHRCKSCGYVFCGPCTPKACRKKLPASSGDPVRHCCSCFTITSTRRPSSDRTLALAASVVAASSSSSNASAAIKPKSRMRSIFLSNSEHSLSSASLSKNKSSSCSALLKAAASASSSSTSSSSGTSATTMNSSLNARRPGGRIALRPPRTLKSVLTTLLDQLSVSQRMIMKTASVIGPVFDEETLRGSCPIKAHMKNFAFDMQELERLSMIRRIDTFIGGLGARAPVPMTKVKFEFNHGFMQDVLRSQMLCVQVDKLIGRIAECREQQQKELRHKFFEKAKTSLLNPSVPLPSPPPVMTIKTRTLARRRSSDRDVLAAMNQQKKHERQSPSGLRRSTGGVVRRRPKTTIDNDDDVEEDEEEDNVLESTGSNNSIREDEAQDLSASRRRRQERPRATILLEPATAASLYSPEKNPPSVQRPAPAFTQLKAGSVFVRKQSSVFSHLTAFTSLGNARLWKKRYAVLQNTCLVLQYHKDDMKPSSSSNESTHGTTLFLKGAKVALCDPDVTAKVNCFQVEVNEWSKGKHCMNQKRQFVIGVDHAVEVENWMYLIKYAIESLENQSE